MAGGVPEFWGRLNGEISRFEMGGLTVLREVGRLKEVEINKIVRETAPHERALCNRARKQSTRSHR